MLDFNNKTKKEETTSKTDKRISEIRDNYSHQKLVVEQNGKSHSMVKIIAAKDESAK